MNYIINNYLINVINTASSAMLDHFVVGLPPDDLYAMLCSENQDMLAAFKLAASYMEPANYHDVVELPVLMRDTSQPINVTFTIMMENSERYHRYLIPKRKPMLTPQSKIYPAMETSIKLSQEWKMTSNLVHRFSDLSVEQIVYLLPWIRELAADAVIGMDSDKTTPAEFLRSHGCGRVQGTMIETVRTQFKRMANPNRCSIAPSLTMRINQACRLGDKLFGQYRMLKGKEARIPTGSYVCVAMTDTMLPDWYRTDMAGVMAAWTEKKNLREADRIHAKKMRHW